MQQMSFGAGALTVSLVVFGSGIATAQNFPSKPIRIVTGGAGGGSDFASRQIAQALAGPLGQPVVVDNRVAQIGRETLMKAPPDGHLLLVQGSILWLSPLLGPV